MAEDIRTEAGQEPSRELTEEEEIKSFFDEDGNFIGNDESATASAQDGSGDGDEAEDGKKKDHMPEIHVSDPVQVKSQQELDDLLARHALWKQDVLNPRAKTAAGRANFRDSDLTAFSLAGADLAAADLSGANMAGVDLSSANLTAANLRGAKLMAADLRGARLTRARIEGADFRGADLTDAVLTGVDLSLAVTEEPKRAAAEAGPEDQPEAVNGQDDGAEASGEEQSLMTPDSEITADDPPLPETETSESETIL